MFIKSLAERIKTNVKRKTQRRSAETSPEKHSSAQGGSAPKNSIYSSTFKNQRDPSHNLRDFSKEIRTDLVNEMIQEWGKLSSVEAKMQISDQINQLKGTQSPQHILNTNIKADDADKGQPKRRKGFSSHFSQSIISDVSSQSRKVGSRKSHPK